MKKFKVLLLSAASMLSLSGCNGTKKVEFKEFRDALSSVSVNDVKEWKSIKVSGKIVNPVIGEKDLNKVEVNMEEAGKGNWSASTVNETVYLAWNTATYFNMRLRSYWGLFQQTGTKYYIGNGYKIVCENSEYKATIKWDKNCKVTFADVDYLDGQTTKIKVSAKY